MEKQNVDDVNVEQSVSENVNVKEQMVANEPKKKKSFKGLIVTIIIVLLVIAGGGALFYFYEYKSASKRLEYLANNLFGFTEKVKQEKIELSSGKYELTLKAESNGEELSTKLNGTYGVDLKNKILDYTINVSSLNMNQELLPSELNLELYANDDKLYLYAKNFYDKYIYMDLPEMNEIFEELAKEDKDYTDIVNGINDALVKAVNTLETTQTVKDVEINDKKEKANVITIEFTKKNQEEFVTTFMDSIYENKELISELADLTETSEDELKDSIKEAKDELDDMEYEDEEMTIEIYSSLFGKELLGIKMFGENDEGDDCSIELYAVEDGFTVEFIEDKESILKAEVISTTKEDSKTVTEELKIDLTVKSDDDKFKISLDIKADDDVKPNVEKRDIKNSVKVEELTDDDYQKIYNNVTSYGVLGKYLESLMKKQIINNGSDNQIIGDTEGTAEIKIPSSNL